MNASDLAQIQTGAADVYDLRGILAEQVFFRDNLLKEFDQPSFKDTYQSYIVLGEVML